MVEKIKSNTMPAPLAPAIRVKRTDSRERNNPQSQFRENRKQKPKKKIEDTAQAGQASETEISVPAAPHSGQAARKGADHRRQSDKSERSRLIDIRV